MNVFYTPTNVNPQSWHFENNVKHPTYSGNDPIVTTITVSSLGSSSPRVAPPFRVGGWYSVLLRPGPPFSTQTQAHVIISNSVIEYLSLIGQWPSKNTTAFWRFPSHCTPNSVYLIPSIFIYVGCSCMCLTKLSDLRHDAKSIDASLDLVRGDKYMATSINTADRHTHTL